MIKSPSIRDCMVEADFRGPIRLAPTLVRVAILAERLSGDVTAFSRVILGNDLRARDAEGVDQRMKCRDLPKDWRVLLCRRRTQQA